MNATSTLTVKGQTTIPKEIREYLGIQPRERLAFGIRGGHVVLARAGLSVSELAGSLKSPVPPLGKTGERAGVAGHLHKRHAR